MRKNETSKKNIPSGVVPSVPWRVVSVDPLPRYQLKVVFQDGQSGLVDLSGLILGPKSGVFTVLRDEILFRQVYVDLGAVTWPGEIDLAPDAMYEAIKQDGKWSVH